MKNFNRIYLLQVFIEFSHISNTKCKYLSRIETKECESNFSIRNTIFLSTFRGIDDSRGRKNGMKRETWVARGIRRAQNAKTISRRKRANGAKSRKTIHTCVRARKRRFGACGRSRPFGYIAPLASGHSSATSRASRRLHHTYAAEHYITENDEPRVQSPGTLASSTCVMRRAQHAAAQQRGEQRYTRNSRNRNDRRYIEILFHTIFKCSVNNNKHGNDIRSLAL